MQSINIQNFQVFLIFRIFGVTEGFEIVRLLQTILFWQILFSLHCVLVLMALWFSLMSFSIEKLEYSRYNARTKYELVYYSTCSSDLFSYTNGSHEGFRWVLCDWSFQVLGYLTMDEGIRTKKSLSLGVPMASQAIIQRESRTKLGDARVASPLSSNDHRYFTRS